VLNTKTKSLAAEKNVICVTFNVFLTDEIIRLVVVVCVNVWWKQKH